MNSKPIAAITCRRVPWRHKASSERIPGMVYGTELLAFCFLAGIVLGDLLGAALGVKTNVGGVGIAMLLLVFTRLFLQRSGRLLPTSEAGIHYWGAMYIPVVVAMAAQQDVVKALSGG